MTGFSENLSQAVVTLPAVALQRMVRLVRVVERLSRNEVYRQQVEPQLPDVARFDPGHDAVMMCYDFHVVGDVPRLIEVNTNAGGGMLAILARDPDLPADHTALSTTLRARLLRTFSEEIDRFSSGAKSRPQRLAIIDEHPTEQYLYPEMCAFAELFRAWGVPTDIVEPRQLQATAEGVWLDGQAVDMIYNRHCDFYLAGDDMTGLQEAYLAGQVCLTPNPRMYGLLADKRRMVLWSDPENWGRWALPARDQHLLEQTLPKTTLLADHDPQQLWPDRKKWVFKPVDSFGSRGVLIGEKISRTRYDQLPGPTTLVQELVPPGLTEGPGREPMKTDLRLYAYRNRVLGVTARLYRGQVTNMRTPGGGFARVKVE